MVFDYLNIIAKEIRPKLPGTHDFLHSGHSKEVTTKSTTFSGIKNLLSFSMGETTMKGNVDIVMIKVVTDEEVARGLMLNTSSIITSEVGG